MTPLVDAHHNYLDIGSTPSIRGLSGRRSEHEASAFREKEQSYHYSLQRSSPRRSIWITLFLIPEPLLETAEILTEIPCLAILAEVIYTGLLGGYAFNVPKELLGICPFGFGEESKLSWRDICSHLQHCRIKI